jgi:hypothetical protein
VRARGGARGFAQPSERKHASGGDLTRRRHQHIEIARERDVLKAVVENVDAGAKAVLGNLPGKMAIFRDDHDEVGERPREHQRFVAGVVEVGQHARSIRYDDRANISHATSIATAQDGGMLAMREQIVGDEGDERRLSRSADTQIANTDDGLPQPASCFGVPLVPAPAHPDSRTVEEVKQWV